MESDKKITLEKGKIYYLICFALVSGGKSTFYKEIIKQTSLTPELYNVLYVSSDEIRADLAKKFNEKNPKMEYKECFERVGKSTAKEFDQQILKFIKAKDDNKINIVLVDKNYPNGIDKFRKIFCKDKTNQIVLLFSPDLSNPISFDNIKLPFSFDYVFQCYFRLKGRTQHETLTINSPNALYVFLSFLKLFAGFNIKNEVKEGVYLKQIAFSDDSNKINPSDELKNYFKDFFAKMAPFKFEKVSSYQKKIDAIFELINKEFKSDNFKDTRPLIVEQVKELLNKGI